MGNQGQSFSWLLAWKWIWSKKIFDQRQFFSRLSNGGTIWLRHFRNGLKWYLFSEYQNMLSQYMFNPYFCGWFWPGRPGRRRHFRSYLVWPHKTWNGQLWPSLYFQAKENLEWLKFWNWKNTSGKILKIIKSFKTVFLNKTLFYL